MRAPGHPRTVAASLLVTAFTYACAPQMEERGHPVSEALIQDYIDMWAAQDFDRVDELFNDDGVYEDVPDQHAYQGEQEIKDFLNEILGWSPDTRVEWTTSFISEDWAVVEWVWSGTQTGDIDELMLATGKPYSVRGASVVEFENGKIKRVSDYYNAARFMYQIGVKFEFPSGAVIGLTE